MSSEDGRSTLAILRPTQLGTINQATPIRSGKESTHANEKRQRNRCKAFNHYEVEGMLEN